MAVYFIQEAGAGHIKIGWTENPRGRLHQVKVYTPHEVVLLAVEDGGEDGECELHARFASSRVRGEWFASTPELLAHIATLPAAPKPKRLNSSEWGDTGMTDDVLAAKCGVTRTQISRVRRGVSTPGLTTAMRISQATGWSLEAIAALSAEAA